MRLQWQLTDENQYLEEAMLKTDIATRGLHEDLRKEISKTMIFPVAKTARAIANLHFELRVRASSWLS